MFPLRYRILGLKRRAFLAARLPHSTRDTFHGRLRRWWRLEQIITARGGYLLPPIDEMQTAP